MFVSNEGNIALDSLFELLLQFNDYFKLLEFLSSNVPIARNYSTITSNLFCLESWSEPRKIARNTTHVYQRELIDWSK